MHTITCPLTHSHTYPLTNTFTRPFNISCINLFFTHAQYDIFTHLVTCWRTHLVIHSFMHSFIHTFTSSIPILATRYQPNADMLNVFWAFLTFLHHRWLQESPILAMKEWAIWVSSIVLLCISLNLWGLLDFVNSLASEGHTVSHEPSRFAALYVLPLNPLTGYHIM